MLFVFAEHYSIAEIGTQEIKLQKGDEIEFDLGQHEREAIITWNQEYDEVIHLEVWNKTGYHGKHLLNMDHGITIDGTKAILSSDEPVSLLIMIIPSGICPDKILGYFTNEYISDTFTNANLERSICIFFATQKTPSKLSFHGPPNPKDMIMNVYSDKGEIVPNVCSQLKCKIKSENLYFLKIDRINNFSTFKLDYQSSLRQGPEPICRRMPIIRYLAGGVNISDVKMLRDQYTCEKSILSMNLDYFKTALFVFLAICCCVFGFIFYRSGCNNAISPYTHKKDAQFTPTGRIEDDEELIIDEETLSIGSDD